MLLILAAFAVGIEIEFSYISLLQTREALSKCNRMLFLNNENAWFTPKYINTPQLYCVCNPLIFVIKNSASAPKHNDLNKLLPQLRCLEEIVQLDETILNLIVADGKFLA